MEAVRSEIAHPKVLKEDKLTPIHKKGTVIDPKELQDDCSEWHPFQIVCQPAALLDPRLVYTAKS